MSVGQHSCFSNAVPSLINLNSSVAGSQNGQMSFMTSLWFSLALTIADNLGLCDGLHLDSICDFLGVYRISFPSSILQRSIVIPPFHFIFIQPVLLVVYNFALTWKTSRQPYNFCLLCCLLILSFPAVQKYSSKHAVCRKLQIQIDLVSIFRSGPKSGDICQTLIKTGSLYYALYINETQKSAILAFDLRLER